jgi:hypothetical protein
MPPRFCANAVPPPDTAISNAVAAAAQSLKFTFFASLF